MTFLTSNTTANVQTFSVSQRLIAGTLALAIGLTLVLGIGFAQDMRVHNGAHDTRHSIGFPCH